MLCCAVLCCAVLFALLNRECTFNQLHLTAILFTCIPLPPLLSFSESAALASKLKDKDTGKGIKNKSKDNNNSRTVDRGPNGKS